VSETTAGAGRAIGGAKTEVLRTWVLGARPRTLAAAAVPVVVGTAVARAQHPPVLWARGAAALVVALAIQIGTNYANDYSDGIRGTDRHRAGPVRLVASSLASPAAVRAAALGCFGLAAAAGLALAAVTSWWLVVVGAACLAAGWLYTGGPRPYGYLGLGEVFVFAFFGVVATVGSAYVQTGRLSLMALAASLPVGLLATALLEANNLRDVAGDAMAGKRTLAVRLGRRRAGALYVGSLLGAAAGVGWLATWRPLALVALVAAPLAVRPIRSVLGDAEGRELLPVLGATGRLQVMAGVLLVAGLLL
jgi:1,4-dihydroxy-2-naphthoate octaprenyltransferase